MGITQHSVGTDNVLSIANLALVTGHIGREGNGINPLRGQANVQGACDMGALPDVYPGYQKVADPAAREKFEKAWGVRLSDKPGLPVTEFGDAALAGHLKAIYSMGENPLMTEPDITHVRKGLEALEFLAVQEIFISETAELADVIFPSAAAYEKEGTFTTVSYTHLRAHETRHELVCRLLLEKKKNQLSPFTSPISAKKASSNSLTTSAALQ